MDTNLEREIYTLIELTKQKKFEIQTFKVKLYDLKQRLQLLNDIEHDVVLTENIQSITDLLSAVIFKDDIDLQTTI